jgi:hypothetical protein
VYINLGILLLEQIALAQAPLASARIAYRRVTIHFFGISRVTLLVDPGGLA